MSAATSSISIKIYVHLLDEGTTVVRPTQAASLGNDIYRLLATPDYVLEDEHWEFPPGSIVRGIIEQWEGGEVLVAHEAPPLRPKS